MHLGKINVTELQFKSLYFIYFQRNKEISYTMKAKDVKRYHEEEFNRRFPGKKMFAYIFGDQVTKIET